MKKDVRINDAERTRCEVWTRVMGYHRPISSFNIGKKGEVAEGSISRPKKPRKELTGFKCMSMCMAF